MITFNAESQEFLESLEYLDDKVVDAVLDNLEDVASALSWVDFVTMYAWREKVRVPSDTYPGANPIYIFTVPLESGMRPPDDLVDVYCQLYPDVVVICCVAN